VHTPLSLAVKNNNVKLVQFLCTDEYASSFSLRGEGSWLALAVPSYEEPIVQHFLKGVKVIDLARGSARAIWTQVSRLERTRQLNLVPWPSQYYEMSKLDFEKSKDCSSDVRYINIAIFAEHNVGKSSIISQLMDESEESPLDCYEWVTGLQTNMQRVKHYKRTVQGEPKVEIRLFDLQGFTSPHGILFQAYLDMVGLKHFDKVLIVTAFRLSLDEQLVSLAVSLGHLKTTFALAMNRSLSLLNEHIEDYYRHHRAELQDALEDPEVKVNWRSEMWRERLKEDHFNARYKEVRALLECETNRLKEQLDMFSYEDEYGVTHARIKTPKYFFIDSKNTGGESSGPVFGDWFELCEWMKDLPPDIPADT